MLVFILGTIAAPAVGQTGGGTINDVPPEFLSFTGDRESADTSGSDTETFTGAIRDRNGENDLRGAALTVTLSGPVDATFTREITNGDLSRKSGSNGNQQWQVWNTDSDDGILNFTFRYTYEEQAEGEYVFTPRLVLEDGEAVEGTPVTTSVSYYHDVVTMDTPVDENGNPLPENTRWGGWIADPGARDVTSTNYLKIVNQGHDAQVSVNVDFTPAVLEGEAGGEIPIDGNVRFAWCEAASDAAPSTCDFTFGDTAQSGSTTVSFTDTGNAIYVTYQIVQVPDVLPADEYGAAFTSTVL